MAGYKSHMAFGILTGIGWCVVLILFSIASFWLIPFVFIITVIGSFLPDLDSDTGLPIKILLIILSTIGSILVGWTAIYLYQTTLLTAAGIVLVSIIFIYYFVGGFIKRLTHHRGMFHSIPATALTVLISMALLDNIGLSNEIIIVLSISAGLGYLSHLILDEINSVVNLEGVPFIPKKSLGTALKFYSKDWKVTLFVYILVFTLSIHYWTIFENFIKGIRL